MITRVKLLEALKASAFSQAPEAIRALEAGGVLSVKPSTITSRELAHTYSLRHSHLADMHGPHAKQLARSVAEFVKELKANPIPTVCFATVKGTPPYDFSIFLLNETDQLIGCLCVVAKESVSPEEWGRMWGEPNA